ncbi:MAG TPA: HIT domain-containing protein, partial [Candidatus Angelobacter sp.]|nr:HIT domain-containing protein [Candidatus Angelobacter sp.]
MTTLQLIANLEILGNYRDSSLRTECQKKPQCPPFANISTAMTDCLFCKIIAGKIPAKKVYEDEKTFVFEDIKPQAPTHVLIVPKKHIVGIDQATEDDAEIIGYCQLVAAK